MTLDLASIRDAYQAKYPTYRRLVEVTLPMLNAATRQLKDPIVEGRAKSPSNFVRKAIRKHLENPDEYSEPLARIRDGAGLRVIVAHLEDAERAVQIVADTFDALGPAEHTADRYEPNELGYLGIHVQAQLRTVDLPPEETYLGDVDFEVQIQTRAQNAWSTISHELTYKPPAGAQSKTVSARVYRSIALVALFDEQVNEARQTMVTSPGYRPAVMLEALHREFLDWLDDATDDRLSHHILEAVQGTYTEDEYVRFSAIISQYSRQHRERISSLLELHRDASEKYPLLYQPEMLAIAERLDHARQQLIAAWREAGLPYELLDETATALGRPLQ